MFQQPLPRVLSIFGFRFVSIEQHCFLPDSLMDFAGVYIGQPLENRSSVLCAKGTGTTPQNKAHRGFMMMHITIDIPQMTFRVALGCDIVYSGSLCHDVVGLRVRTNSKARK